MSSYIHHLECTVCGKVHSADRLWTVSSCCGKVLFPRYDLANMRKEIDRDRLGARPNGMWRFEELLPVKDPEFRVDLGEGGTPLLEAAELGKTMGLNRLFI